MSILNYSKHNSGGIVGNTMYVLVVQNSFLSEVYSSTSTMMEQAEPGCWTRVSGVFRLCDWTAFLEIWLTA